MAFSIIFMSFMFIMLGVWAIDIGVSGIAINAQHPNLDIIATNGWWTRQPVQQYHIGLWLVGIGVIIIINICIVFIIYMGGIENENEKK